MTPEQATQFLLVTLLAVMGLAGLVAAMWVLAAHMASVREDDGEYDER